MQRTGYFTVLSLLYKKGALKMTPVVSEALRLKALPMNFPQNFRQKISGIMRLVEKGKLYNAIQSRKLHMPHQC
jgi:hypothetical protein